MGNCEGKSWTLAIDPEKELAFCHRCHWKASRRNLERARGIAIHYTATPAEIRERRTIRREAEAFAKSRRNRIGLAALLRDLDRHEAVWREVGREQLAAREPVSETVCGKLHLTWLWGEQAETQWRRLYEFANNAAELYGEFASEGKAA